MARGPLHAPFKPRICPVYKFQTCNSQRPSALAEARLFPPGEKTSDGCLPIWPNNFTSPECKSTISIDCPLAAAINTPFGEKASADTGASHSFRIVVDCGCNKRLTPSSPPQTIISLDGETAIERIGFENCSMSPDRGHGFDGFASLIVGRSFVEFLDSALESVRIARAHDST